MPRRSTSMPTPGWSRHDLFWSASTRKSLQPPLPWRRNDASGPSCGRDAERSFEEACARRIAMANEHAAKEIEPSDRSVLDHIRELVAEEQRLYQHRAPTDADQERLQKIKVELDQYWDLLRQRRALEEFGRDPADAHLRPAQIVEKYEG